jgi:hypothetical protein
MTYMDEFMEVLAYGLFNGYSERESALLRISLFMGLIHRAIYRGDALELHVTLALLGREDPESLRTLETDYCKPFLKLEKGAIWREPDQVWEESLVDDSTNRVEIECPCMIHDKAGKLMVYWSFPRMQYILKCTAVSKLIYCALVAAEEMIHLSQRLSGNSRRILTFNTSLELDGVTNVSKMTEPERILLQRIIETDVTYQIAYFSYCPELQESQWYTDRISGDEIHRPLSPVEMLDGILYLVEKYGYPEELVKTIEEQLDFLATRNPELIGEMRKSNRLQRFLSKYKTE